MVIKAKATSCKKAGNMKVFLIGFGFVMLFMFGVISQWDFENENKDVVHYYQLP